MFKSIVPLLTFSAACSGAQGNPQVQADTPPPIVSDFLYAIRQVESGDRCDGPAGPLGELGAYQFRRQVWAQHTRVPFSEARTPYADQVAAKHYRWIADSLRSWGVADTPWNCAAAWNCGIDRVRVGRIPRVTRDYAQRVQNIIDEKAVFRRSLAPRFHIVYSDTSGGRN
jgi:hypothetical protein